MVATYYVGLTMENQPGTFYQNLKPALIACSVFGPYKIFDSCLGALIRVLSLMLFLAMLFVAVIGVFHRSGIDILIQFSLYIVPILTLIIGISLVNSEAFLRLLSRRVTSRSWATFFVSRHSAHNANVGPLGMPHNARWIKRMSYKIMLYPLMLEAIQWGLYLAFFSSKDSVSFAGSVLQGFAISSRLWLGMYITFWVISVYAIGVLTCLFTFVSRLIIRDVVSYLTLFGYSPVLKTRRSHLYYLVHETCFGKIIRCLLGVLLIDAFESSLDMYVGSRHPVLRRGSDRHYSDDRFPARALEDPGQISDSESSDGSEAEQYLSAKEAAVTLTQFINEFGEITSLFQPFAIFISFFSIANLITHVSLFALGSFTVARMWTFSRTLLWLCVAVRVLVSVAQISLILEKVEPHIKYMRAVGKLEGSDEEWSRYFDLAETFHLKNRTFGFPLNLRQTASIATLLNMGFLIVLSVVKAHYGKI